MKKLSLRPYHGKVWICKTLPELHAAYKRRTKQDYPYQDDPNGGRFVQLLGGDDHNETIYLVYAANWHALAHELAHVLLIVFRIIGHDPRDGDGEPFCYMLSQLLIEAGNPQKGKK